MVRQLGARLPDLALQPRQSREQALLHCREEHELALELVELGL
jgi:hypothetical protein